MNDSAGSCTETYDGAESASSSDSTPTLTNGDVVQSAETETSTPPQQKKEAFIQVAGHSVSDDVNLIMYTLRIDGQTPLYTLSKFLSHLISVPETNFVIYKTDRIETSELRRMSDRIVNLMPFEHLYVKFEQRLKDDESRVPVFRLNVGDTVHPLDYLTEIVATIGMSLDNVRNAILKKLPDLTCDPSTLRIRKKLRTNPSKIMRENMKLQDLFTVYSIQTAELFVQFVESGSNLSDKTYSLMYRHWHPSTGVLDPLVEVTIFHDYSADLEEVILNKVCDSI